MRSRCRCRSQAEGGRRASVIPRGACALARCAQDDVQYASSPVANVAAEVVGETRAQVGAVAGGLLVPGSGHGVPAFGAQVEAEGLEVRRVVAVADAGARGVLEVVEGARRDRHWSCEIPDHRLPDHRSLELLRLLARIERGWVITSGSSKRVSRTPRAPPAEALLARMERMKIPESG